MQGAEQSVGVFFLAKEIYYSLKSTVYLLHMFMDYR